MDMEGVIQFAIGLGSSLKSLLKWADDSKFLGGLLAAASGVLVAWLSAKKQRDEHQRQRRSGAKTQAWAIVQELVQLDIQLKLIAEESERSLRGPDYSVKKLREFVRALSELDHHYKQYQLFLPWAANREN